MGRNGLILAGGRGSRLWPLTEVANKHLLPVHDKPMIYYSISNLMLSGISKIGIVSSRKHLTQFELFLGNGSRFGISITYIEQKQPLGIVDGIKSAFEFLDEESSVVHLADNFFFGSGFPNLINANESTNCGARIFTYKVSKPSSFGILEESDGKIISLEEKPAAPKGDQAITGIYLFDGSLRNKISEVGFSERGEMEIVDLLRLYNSDGDLQFRQLPRGSAWLDLGTTEDLYRASNFVEILQSRQGVLVGSPEEIAVNNGWLSKTSLKKNLQYVGHSKYLDLLTESLGI